MNETKDSEIKWIGEIPAHWKISKLKYLFIVFSGTTPQSDNPEYWDGNIFWITPADYKTNDVFITKGHKTLTELGVREYNLKLIAPNNLIFSKRAPIGSVAINAVPLTINQGCFACLLINDCLTKFYYYLMSILTKQFEIFAGGTTFKEISLQNFNNFKLPLPPLDEQKVIANFLDDKCGKIDGIISECKKQLEILKDYKKSLITETVTKGLNPAAEMKDSGIKWIGEIPAHWKISKVGYHFEILLGKMLQPMQINAKDTLENYLCAVNLGKNKFSLELVKQMWFSEKEKKIYSVKRGDLLVVEGGDIGSADIVNFDVENLYFQNALMRVRPLVNYSVNFLKYWVQFAKNTGHIDLICNKATIAHFTKEKFMKLHFASPPLDEQKAIANFLDDKCKKIDELIEQKQNQVEIMNEYKKSVIYEYVTGKKIVKEH